MPRRRSLLSFATPEAFQLSEICLYFVSTLLHQKGHFSYPRSFVLGSDFISHLLYLYLFCVSFTKILNKMYNKYLSNISSFYHFIDIIGKLIVSRFIHETLIGRHKINAIVWNKVIIGFIKFQNSYDVFISVCYLILRYFWLQRELFIHLIYL